MTEPKQVELKTADEIGGQEIVKGLYTSCTKTDDLKKLSLLGMLVQIVEEGSNYVRVKVENIVSLKNDIFKIPKTWIKRYIEPESDYPSLIYDEKKDPIGRMCRLWDDDGEWLIGALCDIDISVNDGFPFQASNGRYYQHCTPTRYPVRQPEMLEEWEKYVPKLSVVEYADRPYTFFRWSGDRSRLILENDTVALAMECTLLLLPPWEGNNK